MILNMHIRNDHANWGVSKPRRRVKSLCGVESPEKLTGVPGITYDQPAGVFNSGVDYGWCPTCCRQYLLDTNPVLLNVTNQNLLLLYVQARQIALKQLYLVNEG
jgi:hypothetical protein